MASRGKISSAAAAAAVSPLVARPRAEPGGGGDGDASCDMVVSSADASADRPGDADNVGMVLDKAEDVGGQLPPPPPPPPPPFTTFSASIKILLVLMTVFATLFSPLSSFIYLPAITPIAYDYGRSVADINLSVTLYQVMQALGPLFLGDLSDRLGRRPVYLLMFVIYVAANVGLALQHSYAALLALRALQSTGCSATVAIGSAVMADFTTRAERGGYISAVQASIMFAPALAPVLGGILTEFLGWRAIFWFLAIAAAVFLAVYLPFVPESARKVVGDGSLRPPTTSMSLTTARHLRRLRRLRRLRDAGAAAGAASPKAAPATPHRHGDADGDRTRCRLRRIPVPNIWAAVRIMFEKDVGLMLLLVSLLIMASYAMLVPLQDALRLAYAFDDLQVGLCYIPYAIGSVAGSACAGRLLNWNYARIARSIADSADSAGNGNGSGDTPAFPIELARLQVLAPWTLLAVATIAAWGWVVAAAVDGDGSRGATLTGLLVVLFFSGAAVSAPVSALSTLLVDLYPQNPGRVSSTFNLTRSSLSAVGTAVVQQIIDAWGYGFTYLFLALLVLAACPSIFVVRRWGPAWREARARRLAREAATKAAR